MIEIGNKKFEVIKDYRDGFDEEVFVKKYMSALDKYNVIVGDIASNLMRLKGFTTKGNKRSSKHVNAIPDYLNEACNYNCPYFIVKRVGD